VHVARAHRERRRATGVAGSADGRSALPQTCLRPVGRGGVRALAGEPVLAVLHRRGILPDPAAVRPQFAGALAQASGRGGHGGVAGPDDCRCALDEGGEGTGPGTGDRGQHRAGEGGGVPDRQPTIGGGPPQAGAPGQAPRHCAAAELRTGRAHAPSPCWRLCTRQAVQADAPCAVASARYWAG